MWSATSISSEGLYRLRLLALAVCLLPTAISQRPNIVLIVADDLGFNDVGFHGGDVRTPNIDALAGHGIVLNRHYSQPSCTPSRASLLTGRYPTRTGMQGKPLAAGVAKGLPLKEKIFPQYFQELGYKTHLVGKWHLGYETREHLPTRRGFDTFFGYLNGFIGYYDAVHTQSMITGRDFRRGEESAWSEVYGRYQTDVLTKEAVSVIRTHGSEAGGGGMLLFLNHMAPHTGNLHFLREAPPGVGTNQTDRQIYAEMVRWLDDSVGEVVEALDETGILNNTIIVFMSDNGAPTYDAAWGYSNFGSNWPFRGEKMSLHEGGVRTAALVWSPLLKHRISDDLFSIADWLPTLYSAAGGSTRGMRALDGMDHWSSLSLETEGTRKELLIGMDETYRTEALIDGNWKIIKNFQPSSDQGSNDLYYSESGRDSTYDVEDVKYSRVGKILGPSLVPYDEVRRLASPTEDCLDKNASIATDCHNKHCLYAIFEDPTECKDLAREFPLVVEQLTAKLRKHRALLVPRLNRTFDRRSDPCYWDDIWSPWLESSSASSLQISNLFAFWIAFVTTVLYVLRTL